MDYHRIRKNKTKVKNLTKRKITKIEIQKKRKNRCSVFLDEEFAFGIDQELLIEFGLVNGAFLSDTDVEAILEAENKRAAKTRAFGLLAYRDRSEKEIHDRLKKIGYDEETTNWVVSELKRLNLINDKRFAVSFAKSKMISKPMGRFLLKQELLQKGLSDTIIEITLAEVYQETSESSLAFELAEKQMKKYRTLEQPKAKKRLSDFLIRRGFSWEIVKNITHQLKL
ncbi:MAG: RecX family transcriptional regulator [candidate division KSB1 bacterium]|nr:RecX family transcriptional regulator [candidate division KSB1 bacterium]